MTGDPNTSSEVIDTNRTELRELRLAHRILAGVGGAGLIVLAVYSLLSPPAGMKLATLTWSWVAAIAACFSGIALGLLFGLPNVRRVEIVNKNDGTPGAIPDRNALLGYAESTNLEQVADWLTKIIIGLTLTQYHHWEGRFAQLSYSLTCRIAHPCLPLKGEAGGYHYPEGMTVPGGFLLLAYATLGFLIAYLWMRGYFISEMEAAKSRAITFAKIDEIARLDADLAMRKMQLHTQQSEIERFKELLAAKREEGVGQQRDQTISTQAPLEMALEAAKRVSPSAAANAQRLVELARRPAFPDDPWKTLFGGSPSGRNMELSATIGQNADNPAWFDISLVVSRIPGDDLDVNSVQFFLHPTFGAEPRSVKFGPDGRAPLDVLGFQAFTVGVLADDGTMLELDLASIPGVDPKFLAR